MAAAACCSWGFRAGRNSVTPGYGTGRLFAPQDEADLAYSPGLEAPMDDTRIEQAKFETGGTAPPFDSGELPWGYGEDRITAMVRDPESAYVYWEITDAGIAAARERLGASGPYGWCNLRVYDTSGRDFDGTNANDYFDIGIDRRDRDYFLMIRRPGSSLHVEVGIRTHEGYFQPIARSGRADFPRTGPSPDTTLAWMTVTSEAPPPCVAPYRSRFAGTPPRPPAREGGGYVDVWRAGHVPPEDRAAPPRESVPAPVREHASWSTHHTHRTVETSHVERWWNVDRWRAEWRAGLRFLHWEQIDPRRVAVELLGEQPAHVQIEGAEMVFHGPWRVTIRSLGDGPEQRVLSTWTMRWVQASAPMIERWQQTAERTVMDPWERGQVSLGASEMSVLRERGASEWMALGASERRWLGASEWVASGASELRWAGASEMSGAAASLRMGASERIGASERLGASEGARAGQGGVERLGASEGVSAGALAGERSTAGGGEQVGRGGGSEHLSGSRMLGASELYATTERWGGRMEGDGR